MLRLYDIYNFLVFSRSFWIRSSFLLCISKMADVDKYLAGRTATVLLDNTRDKYYLDEVRMHHCLHVCVFLTKITKLKSYLSFKNDNQHELDIHCVLSVSQLLSDMPLINYLNIASFNRIV